MLATIVTMACIAGYMNLILADAAFRHRARLSARTFDELMGHCLGEFHYYATAAQCLLGLFGALVAFNCVAADIATPVLEELCGGGAVCGPLASRAGATAAFSLFFALPMAGCGRVHSLRLASALAMAAVGAVVVLLVVRGAEKGVGQLRLAPRDASSAASAVPIVVYALGQHVQSVPIFADCAEATQRRYHLAVALCYALVCSLYLAAALGGAAAFGDAAQGDILSSFGLGDAPADACKLLMAAHVALVIGVDALVLRRSLALALRRCRCGGRRAARQGEADAPLLARAGACGGAVGEEGAEEEPGGEDHPGGAASWDRRASSTENDPAELTDEEGSTETLLCGTPCSLAIAAQTVGIVFGSAAVALLFPQVNLIFSLLGATTGVTLLFGYPALLLLARAREVETAVKEGRKELEQGQDSLGYMPATPERMRWHAWALIALSIVLCVGGTYESVQGW